MNQLTNQKLISTSKTMLVILRIISITLVAMIIVPWIFPTSATGKFLMSFFSITRWLDDDPTHFLNHLTLLTQTLGITGSFISVLPVLLGTWIMMKLTKNYIKGNVFSVENAKSYRNLGFLSLLSALLLQPLAQIFFSASVSLNNEVGQRFISFAFDVNNLTYIFFAIILIIIGHVMSLGQQINDEQKLTI